MVTAPAATGTRAAGPGWVRLVVVALALGAMVALSGVVLGRIFAGSLLVAVVAGAAAGSVGVSLGLRKGPSWVVAPVSAAVLGAYTIGVLAFVARGSEAGGGLGSVVGDALRNGIPRLLTAMIPVEAAPDTVVVPVVAAWLVGLAGAEMALRAGRVLLGMAPVVVLYAGALYVVGPNASTAGWTTLAFVGLGVAGLAAAVRPGRSPDRVGEPASDGTAAGEAADGAAATKATATKATGTRATADGAATGGVARRGVAFGRGAVSWAAVGGVLLLVALVAVVGPWVGGRVAVTPVDPRRYVAPPLVDSLDESPLNRISGWALSPEQRLLEIGPTGVKAKKVRLRLAVLPDYDGITWRVGATYRNAGRVLPAPARLPEGEITEVRQQITVDGLTGRLLPAVATPTTVEGARVAFDPGTGTLIRPELLRAGVRYSVLSELQTPDYNLLPTADVPSGGAVARYLSLAPDVPESVQRLADQLADGNGAAYDRAAAIEDFLSEHYRKVADAPSGHAYPNVNFFLFGPRDQGGQVGTSEQFAASFALLARLMGLPSRVVVGFIAPAGGGAVTAGDALAWPEVLFDGLGWVPFDPLPKSKEPRPVEEDFTPKPSKPPPAPSDPPTPTDTPSAAKPPAVPAAAGSGGPSAGLVAGGAGGSVLLLAVGAAGVIVGMRSALRRRRLTVGSPDDRITGAWAEFTDALRLAGRPVPQHLAATEAAEFAATAGAAAGGSAASEMVAEGAAAGGSAASEMVAEGAAAGGGSEGKGSAGEGGLRASVPGVLPSLGKLVSAINTVGFAPGAASHTQAEWAGREAVAYADALRAERSWWRRVWWRVHPGPLRWHRRAGVRRGSGMGFGATSDGRSGSAPTARRSPGGR